MAERLRPQGNLVTLGNITHRTTGLGGGAERLRPGSAQARAAERSTDELATRGLLTDPSYASNRPWGLPGLPASR